MRISAKADLSPGFAQLDRLRRDIRKAQVRAVNTLKSQAKVAGLKEVNTQYQIGPRTMEGFMTERNATEDTPEAALEVKGKRFGLKEFKPIQTKGGVSVLIKGRRVVVQHSFMVDRFGSQVFAKGAYKGGVPRPTGTSGSFTHSKGGLGRRRSLDPSSRHGLPINVLTTFGPADAFSNEDVTEAMQDRVDEQAPAVLRRELAAVARGF